MAALHAAITADGFSRQWTSQTAAWQEEISILVDTVSRVLECRPGAACWSVLLEFEIARRGRRIDAVILLDKAVVVVEFKTGPNGSGQSGVWQCYEYGLDLRDFHAASGTCVIVPIVVAAADDERQVPPSALPALQSGQVHSVIRCTPQQLHCVLLGLADETSQLDIPWIDPQDWIDAPYRPSLNIIEAAERIFAGQQVREISHATAENLTATVDRIVELIRDAQKQSRKLVCFVTGVPGAGKTLAGLSAAHDPALREGDRPAAVFLSGNGPLVRVVRSALVRDLRRRDRQTTEGSRQVSTFIQNVHSFLGHYAFSAPEETPAEHVVIFDEAQRAWNGDQMLLKRRGTKSEAALMLDVMQRFGDWAVIVALVGFGQEIHQGEAGLQEWGRALEGSNGRWSVAASPLALGENHPMRLFENDPPPGLSVLAEPCLHLATSIRSVRARMVSDWVEAVLKCDSGTASLLFEESREFPIRCTRDLNQARAWLLAQSGNASYAGKCGLVASSGALRLRAYGLEVSSGFRRGFQYEDWFLADGDDVRSAAALEVCASEFECQGLELDWVGVCLGGDLAFDPSSGDWLVRRFAGSRWLSVKNPVVRTFILNKYRVLLTRARRGMVIWIPPGSSSDATIAAKHFDPTAQFLMACGIPLL